MQDKYPPYQYLKSVLCNCPKAGYLYLQFWDMADDDLYVRIKKCDLRPVLLTTPTRFRNDLSLLVREGLVSVYEDGKGFKIQLVGWDDDDEEA